MAGGFKNQAGQVEGDGERVADGHGFGGVIQAEGAGTFELPASLGGVAALGIRLPADPQFPGLGANLGIAGQAGGAIGECQPGGDGVSQGMPRGSKGAGGAGKVGWCSRNIRFRLVDTFLAADPFGGLALVVVAVGGETVAVWAEQDAVLVEAAFQASKGIIVIPGMKRADGAQGVEFVVDKFQDFGVTFASVAEQFTDVQVGKAFE